MAKTALELTSEERRKYRQTKAIEQRRSVLISEVAEARQAYHHGEVRRGTVSDLIKELDV